MRLLAILLNACSAQPGEAVAIDRRPPSEEFLDGERVAAAGLYERQEPAANGCNDFGLAANDPALRPRWREIGNCKLAAVLVEHG